MNQFLLIFVSALLAGLVMYKTHKLSQQNIKNDRHPVNTTNSGIIPPIIYNVYKSTVNAAGFLFLYSVTTLCILLSICLNVVFIGCFINFCLTQDYLLAIFPIIFEFGLLFMIYLALLRMGLLPENVWNFDEVFDKIINDKVDRDIEKCRRELNKHS